MCNFTERKRAETAKNRLSGRRIENVFPIQNRNLPFNKVKENYCAYTGEHIGEHYVKHTGQCTKAFREDIYQNIIGNRRNSCALCGAGLSSQKQSGQHNQPREIINHFCPECEQYLTLVYMKVAGMDTGFIVNETPQITQSPFLQLPEPEPQLRFLSFTQHRPRGDFQPVRVRETHNGKPVITLNSSEYWSHK